MTTMIEQMKIAVYDAHRFDRCRSTGVGRNKTAICVCGWISGLYTEEAMARRAWDAHHLRRMLRWTHD